MSSFKDFNTPPPPVEGWKAVFDDQRKRWYFYNKVTKQTSWTLPSAFDAKEAASILNVSSPAVLQKEMSFSKKKELGNGWVEKFDDNRNRPFW